MKTETSSKPARDASTEGEKFARNNGLKLQVPVSYFADRLGEVNVGPFTSRLVFVSNPHTPDENVAAVAAITIPTNALLELASMAIEILSREEVKQLLGSEYQKFSSSLSSLKVAHSKQE